MSEFVLTMTNAAQFMELSRLVFDETLDGFLWEVETEVWLFCHTPYTTSITEYLNSHLVWDNGLTNPQKVFCCCPAVSPLGYLHPIDPTSNEKWTNIQLSETQILLCSVSHPVVANKYEEITPQIVRNWSIEDLTALEVDDDNDTNSSFVIEAELID